MKALMWPIFFNHFPEKGRKRARKTVALPGNRDYNRIKRAVIFAWATPVLAKRLFC
jgi:hypothetical protein